MLYLRPEPSLHDFQLYARQLELERGFDSELLMHKCLLLTEELGELFELIDQPSERELIAGELADVFIYLCSIAARLSVDLNDVLMLEKGVAAGTPLTQMQQHMGVQSASLASLGLRLGMAIGKLYKAIRKLEKVKMGAHSKEVKLQSVLAETFMALCAVANSAGVNLEQAFRDKEEINKKRTWTVATTPAAQV
jgi:NTP pyrophosphatase (non-canonical NTP hydrolase)